MALLPFIPQTIPAPLFILITIYDSICVFPAELRSYRSVFHNGSAEVRYIIFSFEMKLTFIKLRLMKCEEINYWIVGINVNNHWILFILIIKLYFIFCNVNVRT